MRTERAFTKKDLIVVVCCVAFVVMNLGIIAPGGRQRAKEAVCLSHLRQWGVIFQRYANDNDGKTVPSFFTAQDTSVYNYGKDESYRLAGFQPVPGEFYEHMWPVLLFPYYRTMDMCLCPATTKTWKDGIFKGPYTGWDFSFLGGEFYDYYGPPTLPTYAYGSYGKNTYCSSEMEPWMWCDAAENAFPTVYVKDADNIPLFADCMFLGALCLSPSDDIPPYSDRWFMEPGVEGEMQRFCIDRHRGAINCLFLDMSVRKVGLKQLWQLKWHAAWEQESEQYPPPDPYDPDVWPEWMRDFKNY